ncbi:hypothetical protein [Xanthomonas albilineans]|uniref:Uncharacterized protein n=1 Tax=Xanthomonas albilineans (strain GPE PC73 / CFBP 7063) TaxID=380358 RepID=D2UGZ2_XANAP|nr:hypothetical protein [Xanthomonas albilineans]CBE70789.1 hypothetical protein XALC_0185 [Xanthomonas albilineans GPE PC73]
MKSALLNLLDVLRAGRRIYNADGAYMMLDAHTTRRLDAAIAEVTAAMSAEMTRGHMLPPAPPAYLLDDTDPRELTPEQMHEGHEAQQRG